MPETLRKIRQESFGELIMLSKLKQSPRKINDLSISTKSKSISNKENEISDSSSKETLEKNNDIFSYKTFLLPNEESLNDKKVENSALKNDSENLFNINTFSTSLPERLLYSTIEGGLKETINKNSTIQSFLNSTTARASASSYLNILEQQELSNLTCVSSKSSGFSKNDLPFGLNSFSIFSFISISVLVFLLSTCLCCLYFTCRKSLRKKKSKFVSFYFLEETTLSKILLFISNLKTQENREINALNSVNIIPNSINQECQNVETCRNTIHVNSCKKAIISNKREHLTSHSNTSSI
jgi:hypothetical protein